MTCRDPAASSSVNWGRSNFNAESWQWPKDPILSGKLGFGEATFLPKHEHLARSILDASGCFLGGGRRNDWLSRAHSRLFHVLPAMSDFPHCRLQIAGVISKKKSTEQMNLVMMMNQGSICPPGGGQLCHVSASG